MYEPPTCCLTMSICRLAAGAVLLESGHATDALSRAEAALHKQPNSVAAHLLKGNALAGLRDFEKALDAIDEAVRLDPSRGATYTQLGFVEFSRGRQTDAEKAFRRGVELDPKGVPGHLTFANFLWVSGRLPEAEGRVRRGDCSGSDARPGQSRNGGVPARDAPVRRR